MILDKNVAHRIALMLRYTNTVAPNELLEVSKLQVLQKYYIKYAVAQYWLC